MIYIKSCIFCACIENVVKRFLLKLYSFKYQNYLILNYYLKDASFNSLRQTSTDD